MSIFGPIVLASEVDSAVLDTIHTWLPTEVAQLRREKQIPFPIQLPRASAYLTTLDDDPAMLDPLPAVLVTTAGTDGAPEAMSDGLVTATWQVNVTAIVRGRNRVETRTTAAIFEAAIRRCLGQHRTLGGFANTLYWQGMDIGPVADTTDKGRTLAAGMSQWVVVVDEVLQLNAGPPEVDSTTGDPTSPYDDPAQPYPDWPLVTRTDVTVRARPQQ